MVPPQRRWHGDVLIDDVLERCWQASTAVRSWLNQEKPINTYAVAVAVFPTMEPDDSILAAAASRSTRVQFGMADHVERLAALPGEQDLQHPLQARYIPDDAEALSRWPAMRTHRNRRRRAWTSAMAAW